MAKRGPSKPKMNLSIGDVLRSIESRAPGGSAEEWDNVGLLVGSSKKKVTSAVVSIDLTDAVLDVAIKKKSTLIVNHHPCIFPKSKGLSKVNDLSSPSSRLVFRAIENGISVIAAHTNFDRCALEVSHTVANGLGLTAQGRLMDQNKGVLSKLVVFVPKTHVDRVKDAICEAGAGHIGNYDRCTFASEGSGTFRAGPGTSPFLGKPGRLETAKEARLETVFPSGLAHQIVQAVLKSHPYEEVAYDIYPVLQSPGSAGLVPGLGYGFWGEYKSPKPFSEVAKGVKQLFKLDGFWLTSPPPSRVRKLAFVAGKGASFIDAACAVGCDLFITGEAGYHVALDGARKGVAVMELGHRESERFFLTTMEGWLTELGVKTTQVADNLQKFYT
jgi:dinuclear metal center YbgI/SA1388 family protein